LPSSVTLGTQKADFDQAIYFGQGLNRSIFVEGVLVYLADQLCREGEPIKLSMSFA